MGCGPARFIKFSEAGPRPGLTRQVFQRMSCGAPRAIEFQITSARPGPADDFRSVAHETRAPQGPVCGIEAPTHGLVHGLAHVLPRTIKMHTGVFYFTSY